MEEDDIGECQFEPFSLFVADVGRTLDSHGNLRLRFELVRPQHQQRDSVYHCIHEIVLQSECKETRYIDKR